MTNRNCDYDHIETFILNLPQNFDISEIDTRYSLIKSDKIIQKLISQPSLIKLEELFNSPYSKLFEESKEIKAQQNETLENCFIFNEHFPQNYLYSVNSLEKEQFLLDVIRELLEKTNHKNIFPSCTEKPIKLFATLWPNVLNFIIYQ